MFTISPYKFKGVWVFDYPSKGLDKEAFVQGADTILDTISRGVKGAEDGFNIHFSTTSNGGEDTYSITKVREEFGGNWYVLDGYGIYGWLCPALFKFFPQAPEKIYINVSQECLVNIWKNKFVKKFSFKKPIVMPS